MNRIFEKVKRSLDRDRDLPLAERLTKGAAYVASSVSAPVFLRDANRVGARARTIGRPRIVNHGRLEIGDDLTLNARWSPVELTAGPGATLLIGDGVAINFGTVISAAKRVEIGNRVSFGPYCIVSDTQVPGADGLEADGTTAQAIEIGDGTWLAGRVTVLPGTVIGAGSVITAGSVVSGTIPPGVVAGGMPARVLRNLAKGETASTVVAGEPSPEPVPKAAPLVPLRPATITHRGHVIADFTAEQLVARLADEGLGAELAPFGQVVQWLLAPAPEGHTDFTLVWTRPESAVPAFGRVAAFESVPDGELISEVDAFCELVVNGAKAYKLALVASWTVPGWQRGLGLIDGRAGGAARALAIMNARLLEKLGASKNVFVLDSQRWLAAAPHGGYTAKGWYLGKVLFHADVLAEAAKDAVAAVRAVAGQARKLLVLDLDDTLWGGIVGDVGWQQLRLGGHDAVGEALVDFQRAIKALTRRGIVLGIVSKNEESTALEAISCHPEMVLRKDDFVGWRINWKDKARNVAELAQDLNLGLQSVVFIDDNPVERARVREALPEVLVPEWPEDKLLYPSAFAALRCFDTPAISREDAERTQLYASEKKREDLRKDVGSLDAWLKSLDMKVHAEPLGAANLARTTQLLNKTNQMNLSTRRLTEAELTAWAAQPGHSLFAVHVSDKFGDAGLTGIVSIEKDATESGRIVDFVLSCRVMGRKVEETMIHLAVEHAKSLGVSVLEARPLPTAKNKPCIDFWRAAGWDADGDGRYVWKPAQQPYALPDGIALEWAR